MNEILAVIVNALYPFYMNTTNELSEETELTIENVYLHLHNETYLEADCYVLFANMMAKGLFALFDNRDESLSAEQV